MPITSDRMLAVVSVALALSDANATLQSEIHDLTTQVQLGKLDSRTALEKLSRLSFALYVDPRKVAVLVREAEHFKEAKSKNAYAAKRMRELRQGTGKPRGEQPWQIIKARQQGAVSQTERVQAELEHLPPAQTYLSADDPRAEAMMSRALAEIADREMAENLDKHIAIARGEAAGATKAPRELTLADISPATARAVALASANEGRPLEELTAESDIASRLPQGEDIV